MAAVDRYQHLIALHSQHSSLQIPVKDILKAEGLDDKLAIAEDYQPWFEQYSLQNPELFQPGDRRIIAMTTSYIEYSRCRIGQLRLRKKGLDNAVYTHHGRKKKSTNSYFLALVQSDNDDSYYYSVGRAISFISHMPPGTIVGDTSNQATFINAEWLLSPSPAKTRLSNLPLVLMDDRDARYMNHNHSTDKFLSPLWPTAAIDPSPISGEVAHFYFQLLSRALINDEQLILFFIVWCSSANRLALET